MMRRGRQSGVTLIEVLIAIIVMVLGMVGLFVLFPVGIQASRESAEETHAAIIADSVKHALTDSLRGAFWDTTTSGSHSYHCILSHDLKVESSSSGLIYEFKLPLLGSQGTGYVSVGGAGVPAMGPWHHHPPTGGSNLFGSKPNCNLGGTECGMAHQTSATHEFDPSQDLVYNLGVDGWVLQTYQVVAEMTNAAGTTPQAKVADPTEPTRTFAFAFDVRKVNTVNPAPATTGEPFEEKVKLFEFRIHVFRFNRDTSGSTVGVGEVTGTGVGPSSNKMLISTFSTRMTVP